VYLARNGGARDLITFDMGGTSCDVSLIRDGNPSMTDALEVEWNMPARTLSVDVNSVGAGGGSIAWVDSGGALMVGPRSAGSRPGPACYGFGGEEATVTDANLVLGLIPGELLGGRLRLSTDAATAAVAAVGEPIGLGAVETAAAIYRIVNATMAAAIRQLTVERGIDPRDFHLVSFGGAGGQHAVPVANELGITSVVFAPQASTFSAMGMLTADLRMAGAQTAFGPFGEHSLPRVREIVDQLGRRAEVELDCNLEGASEPEITGLLDLRYVGQSHYVSVPFAVKDTAEDIVDRFEDEHELLFGTRLGDPTELVNVRAVVSRRLPAIELRSANGAESRENGESRAERFVALENQAVPIVPRESIRAGDLVDGPALIEEVDSTHYVPSGWTARVGSSGAIVATRSEDPVALAPAAIGDIEEEVHD
jgi:N-methylhydantoinase A